MFLTVSPNINNTLCDIIYILVFVDNVIHPITDERFCYFIFVDKDRLRFVSDVNRIKSPVVVFVIDIIASVDLNCLPCIIYVIISYVAFIIYIKFWC